LTSLTSIPPFFAFQLYSVWSVTPSSRHFFYRSPGHELLHGADHLLFAYASSSSSEKPLAPLFKIGSRSRRPASW
jgi:hypothetical protein